jgi:cytoskeletal protein CcmA (bactofilin family)
VFGKANETIVRTVGGSDHHGQSVLQEGVVLRGELEAKGDVRLDGRLEGKIKVSDRLTVGATGAVIADVEATEVTIMGTFEGSIRARQRIELKKGARVTGDLSTSNLVIEEGVFFDGTSKMADQREQRPKEGEILQLDKRPVAKEGQKVLS